MSNTSACTITFPLPLQHQVILAHLAGLSSADTAVPITVVCRSSSAWTALAPFLRQGHALVVELPSAADLSAS